MLSMLALIMALSGSPMQTAAAPPNVDVELVLAVDMSGSMDMEEARVQRSGYVQALRHPEFINAVKGGYLGRIAIGYFEWAGMVNEASVVTWQVIEGAEDAETFAARIEARPIGTRRGTSISNAIIFGTSLIDTNAFSGARRVIDISGDGPNNTGPPVAPARNEAVSRGIIINIARGSVIDEPALIAALKSGTILAAGLDVLAQEPKVPDELKAMQNVVLLPHVGSASVVTRNAMDQLVVDNLKLWFAGKAPTTPIPETPVKGR